MAEAKGGFSATIFIETTFNQISHPNRLGSSG